MLNPLKNPLVIRTVLDKAQSELKEAIRYRKMEFDNPKLYLWVEVDKAENHPYICLKDENAKNVVRMTATELFDDPSIQLQLKRIPSFVRPFIKFDKIIPVMNRQILEYLGTERFLKIMEGAKTAEIELWDTNNCLKKGMSLVDIFG